MTEGFPFPFSLPETISRGLRLLYRQSRAQEIDLFLKRPYCDALQLEKSIYLGELWEAEESLPIFEGSPLQALLTGHKKILSHPFLYLPLTAQTQKLEIQTIGLLRLKRRKSARTLRPREKKRLQQAAAEFARALYYAQLLQGHQERLKRLGTLTELSSMFAASLQVEDRLRLILQAVQQHFGFDRVRLYLVDPEEKFLQGELSVDVRGRVQNLHAEHIPLSPASHRFAQAILGETAGAIQEEFEDTLIYLPLRNQGKHIGLLAVDNLLSQEPIEKEDLALIQSFAGQISMALSNARLFKEVETLSLHDSLTHLPVRRYFMERLKEEIYRAERFRQSLSLVILDLDFFKQTNDTYGHQIGDLLLQAVAQRVLSNIRKIDFPSRYGGDEILILLPQAAQEEARTITQRIRNAIRQIRIPVPFARAREISATASLGIAIFPQDGRKIEELMDKADDALYWVKAHGRDGICFYQEIPKQTQLFE
ncbi:MAG: sensor domain-containing diguanylate cyclase [Elusimicrobia bacterium]|nr:sensor domain-containing diguanylate cyclase [Elusimicrobiota bacterium]